PKGESLIYRKSIRYDVLLPVKGRILEKDGPSKWVRKPLGNTSIENLSSDGLMLGSDSALPDQSLVELAFYLPQSYKPTSLVGRVVWKKQAKDTKFSNQYTYGVK